MYVNVPARRPLRGLGAMSSSSVQALQTQINVILVPQGFAPITVDGAMGPLTCGALQATAQFDGGATLAQATASAGGNIASVCASSTPPTRLNVSSTMVIDLDALPQVTPATTPMTPVSSSGITPAEMMIAGGLVVGIIVLVYASKHKKKSAAATAAA